MPTFIEIEPGQFGRSPFQIGTDWMLITAEKDGKANTMTAAWGGLGFIWERNAAFIVIRPQRYTKEFVDGTDTFSLSFFDSGYKKMLGYMGTASGRNEDKIKKAGLTLLHDGATPYFEQADAAIICKKLYAQEMRADCFISKDMNEKWYPDGDLHTLYIAEVIRILVKA